MDDYADKLIERYTQKHNLPQILFHYTTQEGLLGIISDSKLWATDILYLTDEAEFTDSAKLIESEIRSTFAQKTEKHFRKINKAFVNMLDRTKILDDYQIFVCSLSIDGNLLSQWRGYCPNNNGFSIGFDYLQLRNLAKAQLPISFYLLPCFYEKEVQNDIVKELKKDVITRIIHSLEENALDKLDEITKDYTMKYLVTSSALKNRSFSEENEWRLFCFKKKSDEPSIVQFRRSTSLIRPYLNIELQNSVGRTPIKEVYVGPTPHKELSIKAVELFLKSKQISCIVKDSKIPYRAW